MFLTINRQADLEVTIAYAFFLHLLCMFTHILMFQKQK